ncbi:MAG: AAA family ATPase [Bacillota bacterium]
MILEYIKFKNFRQYFGEQTVYFSKSKEKNVTVIHGENGSGKTAFLNMFNWCFYGKVSLPNPEILINERSEGEAKEGQELEVFVEIKFRDNNKTYIVTRKLSGKKLSGRFVANSDAKLHLSYIDERGRTVEPKNPQDTIDQILPESIKSYFFFDGERIDNLSKEGSQEEIKQAIKSIMGLTVLERSVNHLDFARRQFMDELRSLGDTEIQGLIEERQSLEKEIEKCRATILQMQKNRKAAELEKLEIDKRLIELEGAKDLQKQRELLDKQKSEIQIELKKTENEIKNVCSKNGYLAFAESAIEATKNFLEQKRKKGEIPAGIKQQFVQDLLDQNLCICGTKLIEGTEHWDRVRSWRNRAGSDELEIKFTEIAANVKVLHAERSSLFKEIKSLRRKKEKLMESLSSVVEQLDEISSKLDGKESEEIKNLERKRRDLETQIQELDLEIGRYQQKILSFEENIAKLDKKIEKVQIQEEKAALANKRITACKVAKETIEQIHEALASKVKDKIQCKINEVYDNFMRKGYSAQLNNNYELRIVKDYVVRETPDRSVAMSQGERQITSLAFIGSLVDIAREQHEKGDTKYFRGGIYPIVMDSPFGALDPDSQGKNCPRNSDTCAPSNSFSYRFTVAW